MKIVKALSPVIKIAKYTLTDDVRQKSFIFMFIVCAIFIFLFRGCYQGNYMVNGQTLDAGIVVGVISKMIFHIIAAVVMVVTALFSMRVFRRDRDHGTQSYILSKPVARWQYVTGKILGLWILSVIFMFLLHSIVLIITSVHLKVFVPEYLLASLMCSVNLLFVVIAVLLLSLLMPDIVAFLCVAGVGIFSFVAEGIYAMSHSQIAQAIVQQPDVKPDLTWWKIAYSVWPKLSGMQQFASSFIRSEAFHGTGSFYPLINIAVYCLVLGVLLFWRFRNEEII